MLELCSLTRRYARIARPAVDGVSLQLRPGITGLLGPNGAGKSTLIRMIVTAERPTEGSLRWDGRPVVTPAERRAFRGDLGYLPQTFDFDHGMTCHDVLAYIAWMKRIPGPLATTEVRRVLAEVGLVDAARTRTAALSGGMRQRLGLAQSLLGRPRILVLDEPTVGLDPRQRHQVRQVLQRLADDCVVVFSTHLVEEVASLGGHAVVMADGRVPFSGTVADLAARGGGSADSVGALEAGLLSFFATADAGEASC